MAKAVEPEGRRQEAGGRRQKAEGRRHFVLFSVDSWIVVRIAEKTIHEATRKSH
jgi:hypothetical protein